MEVPAAGAAGAAAAGSPPESLDVESDFHMEKIFRAVFVNIFIIRVHIQTAPSSNEI